MNSTEKPLVVYLVRHAHPVMPGTPGYSEDDRPLSERGVAEAVKLVDQFERVRINKIYSSPYLRARQTIAPLAQRLKMEIDTIEDLRERMLSAEALADWREHLQRSWKDFDYAPQGGESSRIAQQRVMRVLDRIRARHAEGETLIAASHGNLIALALNALDPTVDFDFWEAIPTPAVFRLENLSGHWRIALGSQPV